MAVNHILSSDSIPHSMSALFWKDSFAILHCFTCECHDFVDPEKNFSYDDRCNKWYNAQVDLLEWYTILMKCVTTFPGVIPFLTFAKKEDFTNRDYHSVQNS
jgi:hypothetical protein